MHLAHAVSQISATKHHFIKNGIQLKTQSYIRRICNKNLTEFLKGKKIHKKEVFDVVMNVIEKQL